MYESGDIIMTLAFNNKSGLFSNCTSRVNKVKESVDINHY